MEDYPKNIVNGHKLDGKKGSRFAIAKFCGLDTIFADKHTIDCPIASFPFYDNPMFLERAAQYAYRAKLYQAMQSIEPLYSIRFDITNTHKYVQASINNDGDIELQADSKLEYKLLFLKNRLIMTTLTVREFLQTKKALIPEDFNGYETNLDTQMQLMYNFCMYIIEYRICSLLRGFTKKVKDSLDIHADISKEIDSITEKYFTPKLTDAVENIKMTKTDGIDIKGTYTKEDIKVEDKEAEGDNMRLTGGLFQNSESKIQWFGTPAQLAQTMFMLHSKKYIYLPDKGQAAARLILSAFNIHGKANNVKNMGEYFCKLQKDENVVNPTDAAAIGRFPDKNNLKS